MSEQSETSDAEISAMAAVWSALSPLDEAGQQRVIQYVLGRLNLNSLPTRLTNSPVSPASASISLAEPARHHLSGGVSDIRSFAQLKAPRSANEMAAVVAYFLQYEAGDNEKKNSITAEDIKRYFHLAKFPMPKQPRYTLTNAKNAGYLDQQDQGHYRLNAVGHNLVDHTLPATSSAEDNRK